MLAHRRTREAATIILVHNLGSEPVSVSLNLTPGEQTTDAQPTDLRNVLLLDLLGHTEARASAAGMLGIELQPYGYRWLRVPHPHDHRLP